MRTLPNVFPVGGQCKGFLKNDGASAAFHLLLMFVLGFSLLETEKNVPGAAITSVFGPQTEDLKDLEPLEDPKIGQISQTNEPLTSSDAAASLKPDVDVNLSALNPQMGFSALGGGDSREASKEAAEPGEGMEKAVDASFFGAKSRGGRLVFVVDNSLSVGAAVSRPPVTSYAGP